MVKQKEEFDHVAMMKDPNRWQWFVLPLKRRVDGIMEIGCLMGDGSTVYRFGMYDRNVDLEAVEKHRYETFEAMYEDGWRVD